MGSCIRHLVKRIQGDVSKGVAGQTELFRIQERKAQLIVRLNAEIRHLQGDFQYSSCTTVIVIDSRNCRNGIQVRSYDNDSIVSITLGLSYDITGRCAKHERIRLCRWVLHKPQTWL